MPNFLSPANGGPSVEASASVNSSGVNFSGSIGPVSVSVGGGGFSFSGSKPIALHTEFAQEGANWGKPYGSSTEIIFYLMRADQ